jgi:hypothetical protein
VSDLQRIDEWYEARRGRLTASNFRRVLAKPTSKTYQRYIVHVARQIIGAPDLLDDEDTPWYAHGRNWEAEALGSYVFETGIVVQQVGFIVHPQYDFIGASPDGLVDDDGGTEIKCRKSLAAFNASVLAGVDSEHLPQIQGCMWVTGRQWWDYVSYYKKPEMMEFDLHIHRVFRDENYIARIEQACLRAWDDIQAKVKEMKDGARR